MQRRTFLGAALAGSALKLRKLEWIPIEATPRTLWLHVRIHADDGSTGIGEASDAFGLKPTTRDLAPQVEAEVRRVYRMAGEPNLESLLKIRTTMHQESIRKGLLTATAVSALEQAAWDLYAKRLNVPLVELLGGKLRDSIEIYANINRATKDRTPAGFAATAKRAYAEGFRAFKAAPFDGGVAVDLGVDCVYAIRGAIGPEAKLMVDAHSFFDVRRGIALGKKLEGAKLTWFEEPVAPELVRETKQIRENVAMPMAGGETLYGVEGFLPLCREKAVDVIMPDVKHCGGIREMMSIARMAEAHGIEVAPHNPSGPVATAFSLAACGAMPNCRTLEIQYGEVAWRGRVIRPEESVVNGRMMISARPGCGVELGNL